MAPVEPAVANPEGGGGGSRPSVAVLARRGSPTFDTGSTFASEGGGGGGGGTEPLRTADIRRLG